MSSGAPCGLSTLSGLLESARILQYRDILEAEGWDDVEYMYSMNKEDKLKDILAAAPIFMKHGHFAKLHQSLEEWHERTTNSTAASPTAAVAAAAPAAALTPPRLQATPAAASSSPVQASPAASSRPVHAAPAAPAATDAALVLPRQVRPIGADDGDAGQDGELAIYWDLGFKYAVTPDDYSTVGELLEAVRAQAERDRCPKAPSAHPRGVDEWASLHLPRVSNHADGPRVSMNANGHTTLKCGERLDDANVRILKAYPKGCSVNVMLHLRSLRRQQSPHTPYFRTADDAKVAICDPGTPNMQYDATDQRTFREVSSDAAELRFYLRAGGPKIRHFEVEQAEMIGRGAQWTAIDAGLISLHNQSGEMRRLIVHDLMWVALDSNPRCSCSHRCSALQLLCGLLRRMLECHPCAGQPRSISSACAPSARRTSKARGRRASPLCAQRPRWARRRR